MIRTKNNQVIKVIGSGVTARANVMHVNDNIPSANHTRCTKVFYCVQSGCNTVICAPEVGVILPRNVAVVTGLVIISKSMLPRTAFRAKTTLSGHVRLSVEHISAMFTSKGNAWDLPQFLWHLCEYLRLSLIRAKTRTEVIALLSFRRFTIERFTTHRAGQIIKGFLLSLRGAFARTKTIAPLNPFHGTGVPLESLAACCTGISIHR